MKGMHERFCIQYILEYSNLAANEINLRFLNYNSLLFFIIAAPQASTLADWRFPYLSHISKSPTVKLIVKKCDIAFLTIITYGIIIMALWHYHIYIITYGSFSQ